MFEVPKISQMEHFVTIVNGCSFEVLFELSNYRKGGRVLFHTNLHGTKQGYTLYRFTKAHFIGQDTVRPKIHTINILRYSNDIMDIKMILTFLTFSSASIW